VTSGRTYARGVFPFKTRGELRNIRVIWPTDNASVGDRPLVFRH